MKSPKVASEEVSFVFGRVGARRFAEIFQNKRLSVLSQLRVLGEGCLHIFQGLALQLLLVSRKHPSEH